MIYAYKTQDIASCKTLQMHRLVGTFIVQNNKIEFPHDDAHFTITRGVQYVMKTHS